MNHEQITLSEPLNHTFLLLHRQNLFPEYLISFHPTNILEYINATQSSQIHINQIHRIKTAMNMNYYAPVNTQPPAEHVPHRNRELDLEAAIAWLSDGLDRLKRDIQALGERIRRVLRRSILTNGQNGRNIFGEAS